MSAPDFYFGIQSIAKHLHDRYGKEVLIDYWRSLGREYYANRIRQWRSGGVTAVAEDWRDYFAHEPGADVQIRIEDDSAAVLDVRVCPAIKHLRESSREVLPYFCEHCDHVGGAMAQEAGYTLTRTGGMGTCEQRFVRITVSSS